VHYGSASLVKSDRLLEGGNSYWQKKARVVAEAGPVSLTVIGCNVPIIVALSVSLSKYPVENPRRERFCSVHGVQAVTSPTTLTTRPVMVVMVVSLMSMFTNPPR